jgi:hypothetical protein
MSVYDVNVALRHGVLFYVVKFGLCHDVLYYVVILNEVKAPVFRCCSCFCLFLNPCHPCKSVLSLFDSFLDMEIKR